MASTSATATPAPADPRTTNTTTTGDDTAKGSESTVAVAEQVTTAESESTPVQPAEQTRTETQQDTKAGKAKNNDDDDDESDFDELDEVLDDFKPQPAAAAPAPATPKPETPASAGLPGGEDFDEAAFMKQLEQDMASMMGPAGNESSASRANDNEFASTIDQGADAFTKQLEDSGIPPGDFIKQLLADVMAENGSDAPAAPANANTSSAAPASPAAANGDSGANAPENFNDAISRTINRMKESGDKATAAASEDDISDDLVAQLLKAVEAGAAGAGDDGDLTKMFMGMMEQLSNKEMLYEPMKELHGKFGPWITANKGKGKISDEDMARYEDQARIVAQIVGKFEEEGFTDEDPKCREFVWEKMQEMQAAGNPPEELVTNPWMDDMKGGGAPGAAGMPDCPQQ
ncbi:putative peroxisomal membrane protein receptor Pex19 [Aspergillus candidus]|uniref:Pex19 protein family-domain-containing protein n=1 Tax=Aspergillus candidus TaxID=41067 RepID=A0A2I2F645_ASPCN|nr:Pex19 protein family-domain-containing protein [Aspergillus candidus]PLB36122.1 Pex19 protein family-domain-containing protein [Aspergillus candidus]